MSQQITRLTSRALLFVLLASSACAPHASPAGPSSPVDVGVGALEDCVHLDAAGLVAQILVVLTQVAAYVTLGGAVDWVSIEDGAAREGTAVARCAFVEVLDRFVPASPAQPSASVAAGGGRGSSAAEALARLRASARVSGWRLSSGALR